ncbi:phosphoribosylformylglycinamidine synthase I [Candidatus Kaiserbacteria bacterium RIFCSPHIGHO2_02_FULL_59_21]|uniref:Phosphoribosylformylglycinamidine synthase subunit I n=2 Tax=Candidatus Kaiseribacteriota TaxID=1752734 RepID=A0A0G2AZP5_9BACT|nr:MAG: Phosphoribosylformylglycinamidine synthase subunit I [Candidatus Kaiserbacteria bacterium GW2011_GWA2_58_9]OGG63060.1 MAG: phosphoribosylformylglycinamidine synthase I [Candidatus Kaiserbacteria bacterium RIFCSPHIGHO2_01_FULL_58_22]OGG67423.1 MAG: phosphoribosylformylglycinamidine synthase I [Candidatus Kaiserbacteria bacterium RIFCSPHIGHO2_02_FULL_59_21]OGG80272.1 MAG: phosphoribosylformylglycinamidine synthase I [Candidatus Kaiserbacteria bacterium RIFCSPLOWO2_01_FULL_59_34]OGG85799.1
MNKPHVIIFSGYGLNTEDETKAAFESVGATADIVHLNDIIKRSSILQKAEILVFPGGFSYGDHTGAGKAYGNRVRHHLGKALEEFLARDTLMLGVCNGFQILTSAGFLPGALVANDIPRYNTRWVDLEVKNDSPWLKGIKSMSVPIAHGEGKYYAPREEIERLKKGDGIALTYTAGETAKHFDMPANPNGSLEDIAGITGYGGRVLGLMPHPERAVRFTQLPHWTYLREKYLRDGDPLPSEGPGLQLFRNAVDYFSG